jgi:hypothetical protein
MVMGDQQKKLRCMGVCFRRGTATFFPQQTARTPAQKYTLCVSGMAGHLQPPSSDYD